MRVPVSTLASPEVRSRSRPRLHLVHDDSGYGCETPSVRRDDSQGRSTPLGQSTTTHVLVAGADSDRRSRMLGELRGLLPPSTPFLEACETSELIELAARSRMVVLTDDLGGVSSESLLRLLGRRHPALAVLAVGEQTPRGGREVLDTASV